MAFRFRRSVKIAPGIRLNAGKRGLGVSVGGRGGGISFGPNGTRVRAGIPGTGLSRSERIDGKSTRSHSPARNRPADASGETVRIKIGLDNETGELDFYDEYGQPLPERVERQARREGKHDIAHLLRRGADEINGELAELESIHHRTPAISQQAILDPEPFVPAAPETPPPYTSTFWERLIPYLWRRREREVAERRARYEGEFSEWAARKAAHDTQQQARAELFDRARCGGLDAMERVLEERLEGLDWPYETLVSFALTDANYLALDVDLPEIEDIPAKEASVAARGNKLNLKGLSQKRLRLLYANHIHGIAVRLLGECFWALPTINKVLLSAYSQRVDTGTGRENDDYLYSVIADRKNFEAMNFDNLAGVDPVVTLERFELRRNMTKTGVIKTIEPFEGLS